VPENIIQRVTQPERRPFIRRILNYLAAGVFYLRPHFLNLALSYQPDSFSDFKTHSEFGALFRSFRSHNRLNNSGDIPRLWSLILNVEQIVEEKIAGDFAELGVWRGNTAAVLATFAAKDNRQVFLFDTFEGFVSQDIKGVDADKNVNEFRDTSIELVKTVIGKNSACCQFIKGRFPDSLSESHRAQRYSVVSIDCDLYEPMKAGLAFFYPRMSRGGIFFLHDYSSRHWAGAKLAVDEFCKESSEYIVLMPDKSGSAFLRKAQS
jgi:hypothetical protein